LADIHRQGGIEIEGSGHLLAGELTDGIGLRPPVSEPATLSHLVECTASVVAPMPVQCVPNADEVDLQ
jgi:hypothetical protein